jgi:hypothetical protein
VEKEGKTALRQNTKKTGRAREETQTGRGFQRRRRWFHTVRINGITIAFIRGQSWDRLTA